MFAARKRGLAVRRGGRSAGFGLLEAVVALVIFSAGALALYGLVNSNLIALGRAHDVASRIPAVHRAIEFVSSINPREEGVGQAEIDGLRLEWSARLLEPVRQSQTATGGRGYFEVGLYEVEFELSEGRRAVGKWRVRVAGYAKVREPSV